jgi:hypothetical protein
MTRMQAPPGTWPRIADRLRWFFLSGLASAMAGVVVLGIGGRLVMLASRFLHPEAAGRLTENGNRIGEFTFGGTIELVKSSAGSSRGSSRVWRGSS